jgi:predicted transcriptional regulator
MMPVVPTPVVTVEALQQLADAAAAVQADAAALDNDVISARIKDLVAAGFSRRMLLRATGAEQDLVVRAYRLRKAA